MDGKAGIALSALIATFFYAGLNIVVEHKAAKVHPLWTSTIYNLIGILLITPILAADLAKGYGWVKPSLTQVSWLGLAAICLAIAEYFYFRSYNLGAASASPAIHITTTCVALLPVFCVLIEAVLITRQLPTARQCVGMCLGVIAVYLVTKR